MRPRLNTNAPSATIIGAVIIIAILGHPLNPIRPSGPNAVRPERDAESAADAGVVRVRVCPVRRGRVSDGDSRGTAEGERLAEPVGRHIGREGIGAAWTG